jgi:hypothetical protein
LRERSINSLITSWPPSEPRSRRYLMADMDREVVICSYKKIWYRIEAVVDASGDFIK